MFAPSDIGFPRSGALDIHVERLSPKEWKEVSEVTHKVTFSENRPASLDRIDYALVAAEGDRYLGYLTARELDAESVYWQFGGAFPNISGTTTVFKVYDSFLKWTKHFGYKRITTLVENTNVRYLKLAMACGFRIIGVRLFNGTVLVELLNDLNGDKNGVA